MSGIKTLAKATAVMTASAKEWAIRLLLRGSSTVLRSRRFSWAKSLCWSRICVPHLSWRQIEMISQTVDGHRFYTRPTDFVENRLCFFGVWEPAITDLFRRLVRPGDIVLDVGANVGYYTMLSVGLVGARGRVFALEPSPSIRCRLQRNLDLNGITNVEVLACGAWHESADGSLAIVAGNEGGSTLSPLTYSAHNEAVTLRRLDDVVPQAYQNRVGILKIDVEGAEWSTLRGAEAILATSSRVAVVCEISPDRLVSLGGSPEGLVEWMVARGFTPYAIENDYSADAYVEGNIGVRLRRLTLTPTRTCDLLFCRSLDERLQRCLVG